MKLFYLGGNTPSSIFIKDIQGVSFQVVSQLLSKIFIKFPI